ncbi:hypothetical protein DAI22_08g006000 [Oryza sativa Japonica Group]|nr:hypothetical protein DAI22_08g006000 [Oryza sativa Japonica Group]
MNSPDFACFAIKSGAIDSNKTYDDNYQAAIMCYLSTSEFRAVLFGAFKQ